MKLKLKLVKNSLLLVQLTTDGGIKMPPTIKKVAIFRRNKKCFHADVCDHHFNILKAFFCSRKLQTALLRQVNFKNKIKNNANFSLEKKIIPTFS